MLPNEKSEIRLPYALPKMHNPLWMLGFVALMGSTILLYPHLRIGKIDGIDSWIGLLSLVTMLFATGLFYGLALRVHSISLAVLILLFPQTLVYMGVMAMKGILLYHALPTEPWHVIQQFLIAEMKDAFFASSKVGFLVGIFLAWTLRMRMRPAYDLTARLFMLAGGWLIITSIKGLFFFRKDDFVVGLALFNFAMALLFVALSYWQNRKRAFWYQRVVVGGDPAWQFVDSSPTHGFLPPLFQMHRSIQNWSVVAFGKNPLAAAPKHKDELFRALRPRNLLALCFLILGGIGFFGMAIQLIFGSMF